MKTMNNTIVKSMKKVIAVAATATMLLILNPFNSNANGEKGKTSPAADGFNVQYTGTTEKGVVFNVQFENPSAQKFILIIRNADGDVVYRAQFNDVHFNKNVLFAKEDEVVNPTFIVRTADNQEVKQTLEVKRKIVEDVIVTKL